MNPPGKGYSPAMAWSFANLFRPSALDVNAHRLYQRTVDQARKPVIYESWGVPDTPLGRFDSIALHCFLVLNRLKDETRAAGFAEKYSGALFNDMDRSLREMGVGDLSVGKKVRKIAEGFYGRSAAYARALAGGEALVDTLARNLYGDGTRPDDAVLNALAAYVRDSAALLAGQDVERLMAGDIRFADLPGE